MTPRLPLIRSRGRLRHIGGFTITELAASIAIAGVIALTAWSVWEMMVRGSRNAQATALTAGESFNTLQRIEQEVMRASIIEVPDPSYPSVPSMQVSVPNGTGTLRRAFRLSGGNLMVDLKDEGVAPYAAFSNISSLTFTVLDPPNNTAVRMVCACTRNGYTVRMESVAKKRN